MWGLEVAGISKRLEIQITEKLETVVALIEDSSLAPTFHMGQLMTDCIIPPPVNKEDMVVPFCSSSARVAEVRKPWVRDQPWLQRRFEANLDQFQKPSK